MTSVDLLLIQSGAISFSRKREGEKGVASGVLLQMLNDNLDELINTLRR